MALTAEQKASVLKRRDALVASGSSLTDATRIAFDEVAGAGQFDKNVSKKKEVFKSTPPIQRQIEDAPSSPTLDYDPATKQNLEAFFAPYPSYDPISAQKELDKQKERAEIIQDPDKSLRESLSKKIDRELTTAEFEFVRSRRDELKKLGYSDAVAASEAQKEFNRMFGATPASGFGDYEERIAEEKIPFIGQAKPDYLRFSGLSDAMSPQVYGAEGEKESRFSPAKETMQSDVSPSGVGIDWAQIKEDIKKTEKEAGREMSEEDLSFSVEIFKKAYDKNLQIERDKIRKLVESGKTFYQPDALELSQTVFEQTAKELEQMSSVPEIKDIDAPKIKQASESDTPLERLARAQEAQIKPGESIPDYTPAQMEVYLAIKEREKQKEVELKLGAGEKKTVYLLKDGREISEAEYEKMKGEVAVERIGMRGGSAPSNPELAGAIKKEIYKSREDIQRELESKYKTPLFADEKRKLEYLANPEKYVKKGILTDTTPLGGQRETTTGFLIRGALSPFNAIAGALSGVFEGFEALGGDPEFVRQEKQRSRPEGYKDNAVLYNIAENRGFFGEGQETADILGLEGPLRTLYLGGTFAADILDPSLSIAKGLGTGIKVTAQASKAAKALDILQDSTKIGAVNRAGRAVLKGAEAGLNDFLDTSFIGNLTKKKTSDVRSLATSDLARSLDDSQVVNDLIRANDQTTGAAAAAATKDSTYGKAFKVEAAANPSKSAAEIASDLRTRAGAVDNIIEKADDISKGLNEIKTAGSSRIVRSKEVARQLGALASSDPRVAEAFRAVDNAPVEGVSKISQYLNKLDVDQYNRLRKGLLYDAASTTVYNATKEMSALDNLVAATKNTFVDKAILPEIMERAKASDIGKIAAKFDGKETKFVKVKTGVAQAFDVAADDVENITKIAESLNSFKKIPQEVLIDIKSGLNSGYITTENLRILIDGNVDLIAEGIASGANRVARARDVARLPVSKQADLLVPLESRAFGREVLKEWFNRATGVFTKKRSNLSIGQQRLLQEATSKASNMDVTLRTTMEDLLSGSKDIRAAYGIPLDAPALTKTEALAYSIVGTFPNKKEISDVLSYVVSNLFYNKNFRQNIFDVFAGGDISRSTSILTAEGKKFFDPKIEALATIVRDDPKLLWKAVLDLQDQIRVELVAAKAGDSASKALFSGNIDEIVDIALDASKTRTTKLANINRLGKPDLNPIPQEISIAMYYKAQAERIQDAMLLDLATKEIGKGNVNIAQGLDENYYNFAKSTLDELGTDFNKFVSDLVKNRIKEIIKNPNWKNTPISADDIDELLPNSSILRRNPDLNRKVLSVLDNLTEVAEDVANGIIRQNNLKGYTTLESLDEVVNKLIKPNAEEADSLRALFGEDVSTQLQENLAKGFEQLRENLQDSLVRNYEQGRGFASESFDFIKNAWDFFNDFRYTLLLNLRPRFHGANLVTGSDIVFQTTGKIPNIADIVTGGSLPVLSRYTPNKILLQEKPASGVGRIIPQRVDLNPKYYTAREIYELLSTQGGKSVYSLTAPNLTTKRILNLTDANNKTLGTWWSNFQNLPQVEDMSYRYAIFADAIRSGRTESEALALAKKSMFDAADLTSLEKSAQQALLFYGFARNNFVNFVKNLSTIDGLNRISKFLKADRGISMLTTSEEDRKWAPGYTETKIILDVLGYDDKKLYVTSPSLATKDTFRILGDIIKGDIPGLAQGMANPTYKAILGIPSDFNRMPTKIAPEHVTYMNLIGADAAELSGILAGSEVVPRVARAEEGAVNGLIYPLTTPEQQKRYKAIVDGLSYFGFAAPITDWSRTISGEGTPVQGLDTLGRFGYAAGAITPSVGLSKERQEYFNKLSKLQAINKALSTIDKEALKETPKQEKPPVPPAEIPQIKT